MMAVWNMQGASHDIRAVNTNFEYHAKQKLEGRRPVGVACSPSGALP